MIDVIKFSTGAAVGTAGAATASGRSQHVSGRILAIAVAYVDEPPGTTDLLVTDENDPAADPILQFFNSNTDGKYYPRRPICAFDGADILYAEAFPVYDYFVVHGRFCAVLVGADPGNSVDLVVWLER